MMGLEPTAFALARQLSNQLIYTYIFERVMGIEPTSEDWKSPTLTVVLYSQVTNFVINALNSVYLVWY